MSNEANTVFLQQHLSALEASPSEQNDFWQTARELICMGATAAGFPHNFQISRIAGIDTQCVLEPTGSTLYRLESVRAITQINPELLVFASTNAREAQSLTSDEDARDWRYLSGIKNIDNFHVYCGSIEAAINRGLTYASIADVVCYCGTSLDFCDAQQFATAIHAAFPHKKLGVGISLSARESFQRSDAICQVQKLAKMGYDYCFLSVSGAIVFTSFPNTRPWVFFDDTLNRSRRNE